MEILFGGEGNMYLHTCFKKFVRAHDLEVGYLVNFLYEGDGEMNVKVFENESCHIHYHSDDSDEDEGQQNL
jgi:hypothetical protein